MKNTLLKEYTLEEIEIQKLLVIVMIQTEWKFESVIVRPSEGPTNQRGRIGATDAYPSKNYDDVDVFCLYTLVGSGCTARACSSN